MIRLRDDPARLRPDHYPQVLRMRTTFADVDSFRHLNNVALARYFEEARVTLNMQVFGVDAIVRPSADLPLLLAGVVIDYVSQGQYPGDVEVATGVSKIGRSSFTQVAGLFQDGRCVALCDAVAVYAKGGRGVELPPDARAGLERFLISG